MDFPITKFEKYLANTAFKILGLMMVIALLFVAVGPVVVFYVLIQDLLGTGAIPASVFILFIWAVLWAQISKVPQAFVINQVMNVFLAMLLHSERHRYFMGWEFDKPIKDQLHGWYE